MDKRHGNGDQSGSTSNASIADADTDAADADRRSGSRLGRISSRSIHHVHIFV
jgi:hypothetical protein